MSHLSTIARPRSASRLATQRTVLMCRPEHFTVRYRINPWMHPEEPTDTERAVRQWEALHRVYLDLGFEVRLVDPIPALPDMVFAANGGFTLGGVALGARFRHPERGAEGPAYLAWLRAHGFDAHEAVAVNEGEGDFLVAGSWLLAGSGFRTDPASHQEIGRLFDRRVLSLRLVDPRFYHLDTALAVLDDRTIAYYPPAFDATAQALLGAYYPDAIEVDEADAVVLGLNAFSDGLHVVVARQAEGFAESLRDRGFEPVGVDVSELLRGGGGVKCCTLELRR
jgi:N-dimethylarginine dimethylaminohydrolase